MKIHFLRITLISLILAQSITATFFKEDTCPDHETSNKIASEYDGWAERTFATMSLDEKIGQLFIVTAISNPEMLNPNWKQFYQDAVGYANLTCSWREYGNPEHVKDLIQNHHVGGVIFLGLGRVESQIKLTNYFRGLSKHPLVVAQDFESSLNDRLEDTIEYPYAMTLGALTNTSLLYEMGREVARQCKRIGVDIDFAPVVDVNTNYKNPVINLRSFGEFKENVVKKAIPYMQGLQDGGIIADAKHFPGHGDTELDSHRDLPSISKSEHELDQLELYPFKKLIEAGVSSIMTAHLEVPALEPKEHVPTSLSQAVVTDLLRKKLGFKGLIITDALVMKGVTKHHNPGEIELKALLAGNDILLCPTNVPLAIEHIKKALIDGVLTQEILDAHVLRILQAKEWLLKRGGCKKDIDENNFEDLKSSEAVQLQEKLFSQALTLCPSNEGDTDFVASKDAYTVRIQIGRPSQEIFEKILNDKLPDATRIWLSGPTMEESEIKGMTLFLEKHTHILVTIYGLHHYDTTCFGISPDALKVIEALRDNGTTLTIVLFGTPYALRLFDKSDTVLVVYESHEVLQKAAAEIIMGVREANGVLPITDTRGARYLQPISRQLPNIKNVSKIIKAVG